MKLEALRKNSVLEPENKILGSKTRIDVYKLVTATFSFAYRQARIWRAGRFSRSLLGNVCVSLCLVFFALFLLVGQLWADDYQSLKLINTANWGRYFNEFFDYLPPSQGGLNFRPVDAALLNRLLPVGISIKIKQYTLEENDPAFQIDQVPPLSQKINYLTDIENLKKLFAGTTTEVVVYPSLNKLFVLVNNLPFAQVGLRPGPPEIFLPVKELGLNQTMVFNQTVAKPTEPGDYRYTGGGNQYLSGTYYNESVIPFGAWILKTNDGWLYQTGERWFNVPATLAADLMKPLNQRSYQYFNLSEDGRSLRWGNNPFGQDILFWTKDQGQGYPNIGFAPGECLYAQQMLIKDLVYLLTVPGADDFDSVTGKNLNLQAYKVASYKTADSRLLKAIGEYQDNRLPRDVMRRREALGIYYYYQDKLLSAKQQLGWYEKLRKSWPFFHQLRARLRADFQRMGVLSLENRQNILEQWLNARLNYELATPPAEAKYVAPLNFGDFFRPVEKPSLFTQREKGLMRQLIKLAISGEVTGLNLRSVDVLNSYNFGRILNDILGNLYRSHGCLHVSPRNSYFLYEILPLNTPININSYADNISDNGQVPFLSDLVNTADDLAKLKELFQNLAEVNIAVYPRSGFWLIYLNGQPFAKLSVKGGPQQKRNIVLNRDAMGRPVFEGNLAYPTTPGRYRVFKKITNYISNLYRITTSIPMGGLIEKRGQGWNFQDQNGLWRSLPEAIADDLAKPVEARDFTYYNEIINASGEVVKVRWGSQPFGKYVIQTTANGKTPSPELIHSSGDLIMEERQLINDLIVIMAAPYDELDDCIDNNVNFNFYRSCYQFILDSTKGEFLDDKFRGHYKLYYGVPLTMAELQAVPPDVVAAIKIKGHLPLEIEDQRALIEAGVAKLRKGKLKIDEPKLQGILFDLYQYVVTIEKYAHHYITLKQYWPELSGLRQAMLSDFNNFVIKNPQLFYDFMRELMLNRIQLATLSQAKALVLLDGLTSQGE